MWAHALTRNDAWVLCGPDKASLRFGVRLGFRERLVALEWLLDGVGYRPKPDLRPAYTSKWLKRPSVSSSFQSERGVMTTSVDIRAQIVDVFRRDLIGPGAQDADLATSA